MTTPRHRAFVLAIAFGAACLAGVASATTIVVVRSDGNLYLAADSSRIIGAGQPRQQIREACKIRVRGDVAMAAAGLVDLPDLPDLPGGLSLDRAFSRAGESWTAASSLREKNTVFVERVIAEVRPYWQKLLSLTSVREPFDRAVVQTVLVGIEGARPAAIVTYLIPSVTRNVVSVETRDFPFPESAPGVMLGVSTAFNRLSLFERGQVFALPGGEAAKRLVEAEFISGLVGPPVNVVELGSGGIQWIAQSAACGVLNRP